MLSVCYCTSFILQNVFLLVQPVYFGKDNVAWIEIILLPASRTCVSSPDGAKLPPPLPHESRAGFKGLRRTFHQKRNKGTFERFSAFLPVCSFVFSREHLLFNDSVKQYLEYFSQKLVQKVGILGVLTYALFSVRWGDVTLAGVARIWLEPRWRGLERTVWSGVNGSS